MELNIAFITKVLLHGHTEIPLDRLAEFERLIEYQFSMLLHELFPDGVVDVQQTLVNQANRSIRTGQ